MPVVNHPVGLRESERCGGRIILGVGADSHDGHMLCFRAKAMNDQVELLGCDRTNSFTVSVEECQDDGLALELRERDGCAKLVVQTEIGSGCAAQVGSLQGWLACTWDDTTK